MRIVFVLLSLFVAQTSLAQVLATVGTSKITGEDFKRKWEEVQTQTPNPPTKDRFLEELIRYEVGLQEAEKIKLQNDPLVRERIKQLLYNSLLEKELGKQIEDIKITESELKEHYKKNPELHLAHILIAPKNGKIEEARKRTLEIFNEAKQSKKPFADLAGQYSEDAASKEAGGDIGFQSRLTLVPSLYDIAVKMKVGEIRGPIETHYGFHVLKLIEKRGFELADKRQIHAVISEEKRTKVVNDYFDRLKKNYKIEINHEALSSIEQ